MTEIIVAVVTGLFGVLLWYLERTRTKTAKSNSDAAREALDNNSSQVERLAFLVEDVVIPELASHGALIASMNTTLTQQAEHMSQQDARLNRHRRQLNAVAA